MMGAVGVRAAHRLRQRRQPAAVALGAIARAKWRVRMAIGATRWRVVRQLLVESVVLGFIGGGLGLLLAVAGVSCSTAPMQDPGKPFWIVFTVDRVVFGYVAAICVVTAILFGLAPALHVSKTNNNEVLKEGGRGSAGNRRVRWFSGAMVVAELALTIVLLVGAGLMIRSFLKLYTVDLGIRTEQPDDHADAAAGERSMRTPRRGARSSSGSSRGCGHPRRRGRGGHDGRAAASTAASDCWRSTDRPGRSERAGVRLDRDDQPAVLRRRRRAARARARLSRGRRRARRRDVIVNERLAARFFAGEDPIGRRFRFTQRSRRRAAAGRLAHDRRHQPDDSPRVVAGPYVNAVVYVPYRQEPPAAVSLLVRSALPPASVMDAVRREVQAIDPDQPVFTIQTVEQMLRRTAGRPHLGRLFVLFAVVALVLSSVGLYAVMAYSVTQRTQEIGVRMAVGAQPRQVSWLILKLGLVQLAIGLTLGLAGALALSRVLRAPDRRRRPIRSPSRPITLLLTVVSIAACLVPARRATRVDPLVALRAD